MYKKTKKIKNRNYHKQRYILNRCVYMTRLFFLKECIFAENSDNTNNTDDNDYQDFF